VVKRAHPPSPRAKHKNTNIRKIARRPTRPNTSRSHVFAILKYTWRNASDQRGPFTITGRKQTGRFETAHKSHHQRPTPRRRPIVSPRKRLLRVRHDRSSSVCRSGPSTDAGTSSAICPRRAVDSGSCTSFCASAAPPCRRSCRNRTHVVVVRCYKRQIKLGFPIILSIYRPNVMRMYL